MGDVDQLQNNQERIAQLEEDEKKAADQARHELLSAKSVKDTHAKARERRELDLSQIDVPMHLRPDESDDELMPLALAIKERGLISPIIVTPNESRYKLVAGARRYRAFLLLEESSIACEVIEDLDEAELYELMLIENLQRKELPPMQVAKSLRFLLDLNPDQKAKDLIQSLGIDAPWARKYFRLLSLPEEVQEMIDNGDLSFTTADVLRRGLKSGHIDDEKTKVLAGKITKGELKAQELKSQALPTPAPRTIKTEELEAESNQEEVKGQAVDMQEMIADLNRSLDPTKTLALDPKHDEEQKDSHSQERSQGGFKGNSQEVISLESYQEDLGTDQRSGQAAPVGEIARQADTFLLGMALDRWADDTYLDSVGIERSEVFAFAGRLNSDQAIDQLRQLTWHLMRSR